VKSAADYAAPTSGITLTGRRYQGTGGERPTSSPATARQHAHQRRPGTLTGSDGNGRHGGTGNDRRHRRRHLRRRQPGRQGDEAYALAGHDTVEGKITYALGANVRTRPPPAAPSATPATRSPT
jgi:hypothetical protein